MLIMLQVTPYCIYSLQAVILYAFLSNLFYSVAKANKYTYCSIRGLANFQALGHSAHKNKKELHYENTQCLII
jgi:hypothetical protein